MPAFLTPYALAHENDLCKDGMRKELQWVGVVNITCIAMLELHDGMMYLKECLLIWVIHLMFYNSL